jgi:signal transduction histidine kinase
MVIDPEKGLTKIIVKDITELKKTRELLQQSQILASLGSITAGIAHEVNNPLGSILLYSELLMNSDDPSQNKKDLKIIHNEAKRAASILTGLLTYSKGDEPQMGRLNLHKIVRNILKMRRYSVSMQNTVIFTHLLDGPLYVTGSPTQLTQVFMNIMLNAEEALKEKNGGSIIVTSQIENEWAILSISDDGCGIAKEHLNQVFHPLFSTKPREEGSGLGLSTCSSIITAHKGLIHAKNNEMGGATFTVELPLRERRKKEDRR